MPYYVYVISADKHKSPELQQSYDNYRDAKQNVKDLRNENPNEDLEKYRMVFADTKQQAKILLRTKREKPRIEEWEN